MTDLVGVDIAVVGAVAISLVAFIIWPVRALVVISLVIMLIDTLELLIGGQIKLLDELLIPTMLAITVFRQRRHVIGRFHPARDSAVASFAAFGIVSSLAAGVPPEVWIAGLLLVMKVFAVFYTALLLDVTPPDVRWGSFAVLSVGCVVITIGLLELLAPDLTSVVGLEPAAPRAGLPATKSLFYHPQLYAWFCGFVAIYLFSYFAAFRRGWMLALGLLFSLGTILAARRRAILAVLAGVGLGLTWAGVQGRAGMRQRIIPWAGAAGGLLVLALVFFPAFSGLYALTVDRYLDGDGPAGSPVDADPVEVPARFALYAGSVVVASDHVPLGAGLGRYGGWISREVYSPVYEEYGLHEIYGLSPENPEFVTDTFWPQILGETGVGGLIAYLVFIAAIGLQLWRFSLNANLTPQLRAMAVGTGLILAHTLVESLASPIFHSPPQFMLIMLAIGTTLSLQASMVPPASEEPGA